MDVLSCDVVILSIQIKQLSWQLGSCKASLEQISEIEVAAEAVLKRIEEDTKNNINWDVFNDGM